MEVQRAAQRAGKRIQVNRQVPQQPLTTLRCVTSRHLRVPILV